MKIGLGVALATLTDIPFVMKRALAEGNMGLPGPDGKIKKLLFIFLRGANDSLNSLIPIQDPAYAPNRPQIGIPKGATDYSVTGAMDDFSAMTGFPSEAIRTGNGFAALHPSLKYLAPGYNAGDLAMIHRVGYPRQSRSHFDSQNYWENGNPNSNLSKDGIFYRAMVESGLANTNPLTGISIQSALPLILRGSEAAMTNLGDPTRFKLLGVPNNSAGTFKATNNIVAANLFPFPEKKNRELLDLQYKNMDKVLNEFAVGADFSETGNTFVDPVTGFHLFPTTNAKNAGGVVAKYVVDTASASYTLFRNLKAAALVLNKTDAIIAGTELGGFDTHNDQIATVSGTPNRLLGTHANLQRRIGWAMYALRKYFMTYSDRATWENTIVVTLSEFGRTTVENGTLGTDHAEGGAMFVSGGAVKGRGKSGRTTGIFGCHPDDSYNGVSKNLIGWVPGQPTGTTGSMFGISSRYLKRTVDYRSVLGELIRDHLGATQPQVDRIIPGYAVANEKLKSGGTTVNSTTTRTDGTTIAGELDIV